jgi:Co/Zn/Cd efflux system component
LRDRIRSAIENGDMASVSDLHVWSIGPNVYAADIAVISDTPQEPRFYRNLLPTDMGLAHVTVEVQQCHDASEPLQSG